MAMVMVKTAMIVMTVINNYVNAIITSITITVSTANNTTITLVRHTPRRRQHRSWRGCAAAG